MVPGALWYGGCPGSSCSVSGSLHYFWESEKTLMTTTVPLPQPVLTRSNTGKNWAHTQESLGWMQYLSRHWEVKNLNSDKWILRWYGFRLQKEKIFGVTAFAVTFALNCTFHRRGRPCPLFCMDKAANLERVLGNHIRSHGHIYMTSEVEKLPDISRSVFPEKLGRFNMKDAAYIFLILPMPAAEIILEKHKTTLKPVFWTFRKEI